MNKKLITLIVLAAITAGFLCWWFSTPKVLERRSSDLIECIQLELDTSRVQRAFKSENLRDLIADNITVIYPQMKNTFQHSRATSEPVTLSQNVAKSALLYLTESAEYINVKDQQVDVTEHSDDSAKVNVKFDIAAKLKGKTEQSASLDGVFYFEKIEGKWLVTEVTF